MIKTADAASSKQSGLAPPFPGLRPFSTRDHKYFFGREDQTFALYLLLRNNHFVAVIGSSGSGKSSIVKAGLLPLLDEENEQSGKKTWRYATMRPDRDPMHRLANALAKDPLREDDVFFEALEAVLRKAPLQLTHSRCFDKPLVPAGGLLEVIVRAVNVHTANDLSAERLGKWRADYNQGMDRMRRLVVEYYEGFSFGRFVKNYPDFKGHLTDLLIGNLFSDHVEEVFPRIDALKRAAIAAQSVTE